MFDELNQKTELCYWGAGDPHCVFALSGPFPVTLTSFLLKCYRERRLRG